MSKRPLHEHPEHRLAELEAALADRARVEARLRESEASLRDFGEASSDVLWVRNAETLQWEYLTAAFEKIYGVSRERALTGDSFSNWIDTILPDDRDHVIAQIQRVRHGERVCFDYRICRPIDGEIRWLRDVDFPIVDDAGNVAHIGGIGQDITEWKLAAEQQQARFSELQHHVRNTLAVIRSIVRRTMENSISLEEASAHLEGRINAFARVQSAITRHPLTGIDLAQIIAEELRAAGAKENENLTIAGPSLALGPKAAETIGLAVHELATNALKYGALSPRAGCVDIRWHLQDDQLHFIWSEGDMPALAPGAHRGLGYEVLEQSLPYELGATVDFQIKPAGLNFSARIPLTSIVAR